MATGRITKKVLDYIAHINKEAKQMSYLKNLKLSENTGIQLPAKNLLMIVAGAVVATVSFFELENRIGSLETSRELFQADLLKKSEQLPTDQEQFMLLEHIASQVENIQKEMETMRNNNVNINYAMKDIEKIKESLEQVKDKVRANGGHQ